MNYVMLLIDNKFLYIESWLIVLIINDQITVVNEDTIKTSYDERSIPNSGTSEVKLRTIF